MLVVEVHIKVQEVIVLGCLYIELDGFDEYICHDVLMKN